VLIFYSPGFTFFSIDSCEIDGYVFASPRLGKCIVVTVSFTPGLFSLALLIPDSKIALSLRSSSTPNSMLAWTYSLSEAEDFSDSW